MPTKIEWCDETWNPITGCTPISEGCKNCYAAKMANRLRGRFGYPEDDPFKPGTEHIDKWYLPYTWKKPRRIFVCSMGDLFHDDVGFSQIMFILTAIKKTPRHIYMILTKRPNNFLKWVQKFNSDDGEDCLPFYSEWMPKNLWVGVTAENQRTADERIPVLLEIPAAVRFVSHEPMLEYIRIEKYLGYYKKYNLDRPEQPKLDWVICGGETGPGSRPMHPKWAARLKIQCEQTNTPFFFKHIGEYTIQPQCDWRDCELIDCNGDIMYRHGYHLRKYWPEKLRELNGNIYEEYPTEQK